NELCLQTLAHFGQSQKLKRSGSVDCSTRCPRPISLPKKAGQKTKGERDDEGQEVACSTGQLFSIDHARPRRGEPPSEHTQLPLQASFLGEPPTDFSPRCLD